MSQIYKSIASGPIPPTVPTQFTTDDGSVAIPAANNLNVFSRDTSVNNANGIQTTADPNNSDNLYVELTNRLQGIGTTIGATTADLFTFSLGATPASFIFDCNVTAFEATTPAAAGLATYTTMITTGAAATVIDDTDAIIHKSAALASCDAEIIASGNNAILRVTGVAGLTINWSAVALYVRAI